MTLNPKPAGNIHGGPEDNTGNAPAPTAAAPSFPDITTTQTQAEPVSPTTTTAAPAAPASAAPSSPVIIGDRVFTNPAEAMAYANELALERQKYLANFQAPQQQQTQAPAAGNKLPLSQLMFEDPEAYERELRASIKAEIRQETTQEQTQKSLWEGFYRDNRDLHGLEDAVELQRQKHWDRIKGLPVDQGFKFLAAETRAYVSKIRGNANPGERVDSGPATVAGATGQPAPRTEVQASRPSTFMDELKDFRNSKRKTKGA